MYYLLVKCIEDKEPSCELLGTSGLKFMYTYKTSDPYELQLVEIVTGYGREDALTVVGYEEEGKFGVYEIFVTRNQKKDVEV